MRTEPLERVLLISRCAWTLFNFRRNLAAALRRSDITVYGAGAGGDGYETRIEAVGVPFTALPLSFKGLDPRKDLKLVWAIVGLCRRVRPQVVHVFTIKPVIFGLIAAAIARVPVRVAMVTGLGYVFTSSGPWLRLLVESLYRLSLSCAHIVYFQNPVDRDLFLERRLVAAHKVRMIAGSGVDTEAFTPHPPRPEGDLTFVMVGRVLREKGVIEYFDAAALVRARHPRARFVLVGGTDPRNPTALSDVDARALAERSGVEWVGHTDDVRPWLRIADIVVLPSYREGTPMSLLEASAMAKPIIATNVPGCTEVVRANQNGWLVPARDASALADAMEGAYAARDKLYDMGMAGRALSEARFDVKLISAQILGDYQRQWRQDSDYETPVSS